MPYLLTVLVLCAARCLATEAGLTVSRTEDLEFAVAAGVCERTAPSASDGAGLAIRALPFFLLPPPFPRAPQQAALNGCQRATRES